MIVCRHISKSSIIVTKCLVLRVSILGVKNKDFLDPTIKGDSKIVID